MSLEIWNSIASFGTFVVIAATAGAALIQLRHVRSANQIAALTKLEDDFGSPALLESRQVLSTTEFSNKGICFETTGPRRDERVQCVLKILNFFELMGIMGRCNVVDRDLLCALWGPAITSTWERSASIIAAIRKSSPHPMFENFEYLTVLAEDWMASHPSGVFPKGMRRKNLAS